MSLKQKAKQIKDCDLFPSCWGYVVRLEDAEKEIEFQKARADVANEMVTSKQKRIDELKYKLLRVLDVFPRKRQYYDSGWVEHYNDDDIDKWKKKFEGLLKERDAKP
jgi:uncharacterized coiled-coil protein SlyX